MAEQASAAALAPGWYVGRGQVRRGPFPLEKLRAAAAKGTLRPDDWVWSQGMAEWARADGVPSLADAFPVLPAAEATPDAPRVSPAPSGVDPVPEYSNPPLAAAGLPHASSPGGNFLARHWRGDLSLPVSYWVNTFLLSIVLLGLLTWVGEARLADRFGLRATGAWVLLLLSGLFAITVWQLVGTWRSSDRHPSRGGSPAWATVAKVMVAIGVLQWVGMLVIQAPMLWQSARMLAGIEDMPVAELRLLNDGTELVVTGGLVYGTTDKVRTLLDASPAVRVVHLHSIGGWITEGVLLGRLIEERGLTTYTATTCDSACVLAFIGGKDRLLGREGRLGFHQGSVGGVGGQVAQGATDEQRERLEALGVPAAFIAKALSTPPDDMWYPEHAELLKAGLVTAIVDPRQFAVSGVTGRQSPEQLRQDFAALPVFGALREAEPELYVSLESRFVEGVQKGTPAGLIQGEIRRDILTKVVPKYLPTAPDAELLAFLRVALREFEALRAIDPKHCVGFAFPDRAAEPVDIERLLDAELQKADVSALDALIRAAAATPVNPPPPARGAALMEAVMRRASPDTLNTLAALDSGQPTDGAICDAIIDFYGTALALPAPEAAAVLRHMVGSGG
jgi:hypothetical protein